jgi:aromatic ring hydroxylase
MKEREMGLLKDFIRDELTLADAYDFTQQPDEETLIYLRHEDKMQVMNEITREKVTEEDIMTALKELMQEID